MRSLRKSTNSASKATRSTTCLKSGQVNRQTGVDLSSRAQKIPRAGSEHEARFRLQLRAQKIFVFKEQYKFHPNRQWKIDFAYPSKRLGIELDGAIFGKKSGHNTGVGILRKMEKTNAAVRLDWKIFTFSGDQVKSGYAINYIIEVLNDYGGRHGV